MVGKWKRVAFSDAIELISGGTPKTNVSKYWGGDIPWLSVGDFNTGYRWVSSSEKSITEQGLSESATTILNIGDIIISARGTVGVVAQIAKPMAFNQSCYGIRGKRGVADSNFIYYSLKHAVAQMKQVAHGGVFATIIRDTFNHIETSLPPLNEQQAIAHILGTLDDKIELNRRVNETLEGIARAIFKSWFVDFDPVRAKAEGRDTGLPKHIADLFPSRLVDSELGEIPEGWRVDILGQITNVEKGLSYKGSGLTKEGGMPMINLGCFAGRGLFHAEKIKRYKGEYRDRHTVKVGDLVIANTDMTQKRVIIGSPAIVPKADEEQKFLFTHHVFALRFKAGFEIWRNYIYFTLLRPEFREIAEGFSTGTTVLALPRDGLLKYSVILPSPQLLSAFQKQIEPILAVGDLNRSQQCTLTALRDTLLPKLISGELRVPDAERIVGRCA